MGSVPKLFPPLKGMAKRYQSPGAKEAWVPIVEPEDADESDGALINNKVGYIHRALSAVPETKRITGGWPQRFSPIYEFVVRELVFVPCVPRSSLNLVRKRLLMWLTLCFPDLSTLLTYRNSHSTAGGQDSSISSEKSVLISFMARS